MDIAETTREKRMYLHGYVQALKEIREDLGYPVEVDDIYAIITERLKQAKNAAKYA